MMDHSRRPRFIDVKKLHIGYPLTESIATDLWENYKFLNNWWMQGQLFSYSGPPDNTVNLGAANNTEGYFYPILWFPERADAADRHLGLRVLQYPEFGIGVVAGQKTVAYYDDFPTISTQTALNLVPGWSFAAIQEAVYGDDALSSNPIEVFGNFEVSADASGDFKAIGLKIKNICPAAVNIWEMPPLKLSEDNARGNDREFKEGATLRGYDADAEPSLGHLRYWVGDGSDDDDHIERNTRRCYFQYGHHTGIWYNGTGSQSLFETHVGSSANFTFKIRARNLLQKTTGSLSALPALVVSEPIGGDAADSTGSTITMTSARTSDTWVYTWTGSESTLTLVKPGDGGTADLDVFDFSVDEYDEISVDVQCASGKEIIVHTVSLWEGAQW